MKSNLFETLKNAQNESLVQEAYNEEFKKALKVVSTRPYEVDALYVANQGGETVKFLVEYKLDRELSTPIKRAEVLIQVLFYLKRFEQAGELLPSVVVVADKNECFVMHSNTLIKYLDEDIDWKVAPSNAYMKYGELVRRIASEDANPYIFDINENFDFSDVIEAIYTIADGEMPQVHITERNLEKAFDKFETTVLRGKQKMNSQMIVSIFIGCLLHKEAYYQHPNNPNKLVIPQGDVDIHGKNYEAFFKQFSHDLTYKESKTLTAIGDRLIEDTSRRNSGEFWTPTVWADEAQRVITEELGENWRDEYVVWDPACGSKNLTRDYKFKELYCSTLFQSELDISSKYNPEATSFQFDFLNDPESDLPEGLLNAFRENKKIVFLLNPPYGGTGSGLGSNKTQGKTITKVNKSMKKEGMGKDSMNLYVQFLYRLINIKNTYNLTNYFIGIFCPNTFMCAPSYKRFRNVYLNQLNYLQGFLIQASEFANTKSNWGISFTLWGKGKQNDTMRVMHSTFGETYIDDVKNIYNTDNTISASDWVITSQTKNLIDFPNLKSALNVKQSNNKLQRNALGSFINVGNNINRNAQSVFLMNAPCDGFTNTFIMPDNFLRCTSLFTARKLIECNWVNSKDEYLAPNVNHQKYHQYELDSVIYSLFNTSSNQSSLRQIEYKDKLWDIKNEFYWLSREETMQMAEESGNSANNFNKAILADADRDSDRFVYKFLREHKGEFSPLAQKVLDKANELVKLSFSRRDEFNMYHPEYQTNNWDCGWYQIKGILKEYFIQELKDFRALYKEFADYLRPRVYELGFLRS